MTQKTIDDTIDEIHRARREISDRFGGDVFAIAADAARRQTASNRPIWKPKHDEQTGQVEVGCCDDGQLNSAPVGGMKVVPSSRLAQQSQPAVPE